MKRSQHDDEYPPYRTCDSCYDNLLHLKLLLSPWGKRLELRDRPAMFDQGGGEEASNREGSSVSVGLSEVVKQNTATENTQEITNSARSSVRRGRPDDDNCCPICNFELSKLETQEEAEYHVENCIQKAVKIQQHQVLSNEIEGSPTFQNRMLVYKVAQSDDDQYSECPICFEEMLPGEKVGRLECLCVFHYQCIKGWFEKKAQKMKYKDIQFIGKNFCPLHDAVF